MKKRQLSNRMSPRCALPPLIQGAAKGRFPPKLDNFLARKTGRSANDARAEVTSSSTCHIDFWHRPKPIPEHLLHGDRCGFLLILPDQDRIMDRERDDALTDEAQ